jgi:DNA-binding FadR family transcriptional regulator
MERWGLVAQLEAELERSISLGLLPLEGKLPSERTLASQYGVSRTTAREALVRLHARGLVQVYPGRRARAVFMQEAVGLENLGTALLGEGPSYPERQQLLAGYLELKREVTVELLAACCEKASQEELEGVSSACFLLGDAACWEHCHTRLRKVPPAGAPPGPDPQAPRFTPSKDVLWPRSMEEDSWPWPTPGQAPGLT